MTFINNTTKELCGFDWASFLSHYGFHPPERTSERHVTASPQNSATDISSGSTAHRFSQESHQVDAGDTITHNRGTFTLFTKLPTELRFLVWKHVCHHTRNVPVWTSLIYEATEMSQDEDNGNGIFRYLSGCPPPSILSVCNESRGIGLKHYRLSLGDEFRLSWGITATAPARIYLNFATDRICPLRELPTIHLDWHVRFNKHLFEKIAINTNESWIENLEEGDKGYFRMLDHPELWFQTKIREILTYDEDFSGGVSYPLEFEDACLCTMPIDVQDQITDFQVDLVECIDSFDWCEDLEVVRALRISNFMSANKRVPYEKVFGSIVWERPTIRIVRIKRTEAVVDD